MSKAPLLIVGAGGFGREVRWVAEDCGRHVAGYLDDGKPEGHAVGDLTVVGTTADLARFGGHEVVVAIGDCRRRRDIVRRMRGHGPVRFASLIHPTVLRSASVRIGEGVIVCAHCVFTVDLEIGEQVIFNVGGTVGHDSYIGDYCTIAPKAAVSGSVRIGAGVNLGTSCCIREGLSMGDGSVLGMGGVLTRDVNAGEVYVGNPARLLKTLPPFDDASA